MHMAMLIPLRGSPGTYALCLKIRLLARLGCEIEQPKDRRHSLVVSWVSKMYSCNFLSAMLLAQGTVNCAYVAALRKTDVLVITSLCSWNLWYSWVRSGEQTFSWIFCLQVPQTMHSWPQIHCTLGTFPSQSCKTIWADRIRLPNCETVMMLLDVMRFGIYSQSSADLHNSLTKLTWFRKQKHSVFCWLSFCQRDLLISAKRPCNTFWEMHYTAHVRYCYVVVYNVLQRQNVCQTKSIHLIYALNRIKYIKLCSSFEERPTLQISQVEKGCGYLDMTLLEKIHQMTRRFELVMPIQTGACCWTAADIRCLDDLEFQNFENVCFIRPWRKVFSPLLYLSLWYLPKGCPTSASV